MPVKRGISNRGREVTLPVYTQLKSMSGSSVCTSRTRENTAEFTGRTKVRLRNPCDRRFKELYLFSLSKK